MSGSMRKWEARLKRMVDITTGVCFAVMFLDITLQIVARNFLNMPFSWTEEFARFLYVWVVFLGAVAITLDDEHIRVEIVSHMLPRKLRKIIFIIGNIMAMIFCAVTVRGGLRLTIMNIGFTFPSIPSFMKVGMMYAVVPFSMALILMALFLKTAIAIRELAGGPAETVAGSEKES